MLPNGLLVVSNLRIQRMFLRILLIHHVSAIPFKAAPIANSRTPNQILRPSYDPGKKSAEPLICVLFEPARSAEPPKKEGRFLAIAFITSPDEARDARLFPSS